MHEFIEFFFSGPNWFWHYLLLLILVGGLGTHININKKD